MTQIQTHPPMFDELLIKINASADVVNELREAYKVSYFKHYMLLSVNDTFPTFDIDAIDFKQYDYHRSMAGSFLLNRHTWNLVSGVIMNEYVAQATKIKQAKALSEMLYVGESIALNAILKKDIQSIYPNITFENINTSLNA